MSKKHDQKPAEGRLSLHPLDFAEALDALLRVKPDEERPKRGKKQSKPAERKGGDG